MKEIVVDVLGWICWRDSTALLWVTGHLIDTGDIPVNDTENSSVSIYCTYNKVQ